MERTSLLDQLRSLESSVLTKVVRQNLGSPNFVINTWQVDRLSDMGITNPDGLFRFSGTGFDPANPQEERSWSVVLKVLMAPSDEGDITNIWYWKRELLAFQSGLLANLPTGGVKAPRFFGAREQQDGVWIWMEYIQDIYPSRWTNERFSFAACHLARMHAAFLSGRPLPDYPWLSRDQGISWAREIYPEEIWDIPAVQQVIPVKDQHRLKRLLEKREVFFHTYHALPQVFSHGDAGRRNQIFRLNPNGVEELVSIDWAWCGIAPIGWDLSMLLADSVLMLEMAPEELPAIENMAILAYLEELRASGWRGDSDILRLGYCVSTSLFPLMGFPRGATIWSREDMQPFSIQTFGRQYSDLTPIWYALAEHLLDLGEEALDRINRTL